MFRKLIYKIFGEPNNDSPPWWKGTSQGKMYIDKTDYRYIAFRIDTTKYYCQSSLKDGKMIKDKDIGLAKPDIKDYFNLTEKTNK